MKAATRAKTEMQPKTVVPRLTALRTDEVAEALGLSDFTVRKWAKEGLIRATKLGREWRIPISELNRLIKEVEGHG